jgi:hypothetical protein
MLARSLGLLSLALMLACTVRRTTGSERIEGDDASKSAPDERSNEPKTAARGDHERAPIDVVAVDPGEARPCERMCGRVGDCLQTEEGVEPAEATGLEFACLDTCVSADPLHAATTAFQACDEKNACGELLGCTRGRWDATVAVRRVAEIPTQFAAVRDTCESACMTIQSCSYFGRMPDDLANVGTPDFYMVVEACTEGCRSAGEQSYEAYAACANEINCDEFWACASRYRPYP